MILIHAPKCGELIMKIKEITSEQIPRFFTWKPNEKKNHGERGFHYNSGGITMTVANLLI